MLKKWVLSALLCSTALSAPETKSCESAEACMTQAEEHFKKGELFKAEKLFSEAIRQGEEKSGNFGLAKTLAELGDFDGAVKAFKASCAAGNEAGCKTERGTSGFFDGLKKQKNGLTDHLMKMAALRLNMNHLAAAEHLYAQICSKGKMEGCTKQGELEDVRGDREAAKKHFVQACEKKDQEGCRLLGVFEYRSGRRDEARMWFERGCKAKYYPSCGFLGALEARSSRPERAIELLTLACDHNVVDACESLAFQYSRAKDGRNLKLVNEKIKKMLRPECDLGKVEACRRLSSIK